MSRTHTTLRLLAAAAAIVASASCGDVVRTGSAPVFLVIDSLQGAQGNHPSALGVPLNSDVLTNVTSPAPCSPTTPCPTVFNDLGSAKLRFTMKDVGTANGASPTTNNEVTITRYHVSFRRADGRNTPGVDVPYAFDGAVTGTIPANGSLTLAFELVRTISKTESPLVQLVNGANVISTVADVTFYGRDQVGNDISVTGSITVNFANFGD